MIIDLSTTPPNDTYHLMTQTVVPRPIAWVLTENEVENSHNLAPFSYFNSICSDPALLLFSCNQKGDGQLKDTCVNIARTKNMVIHIPEIHHLQAVQDSASPLDYGESELSLTGMELCPFDDSEHSAHGYKRLQGVPIAFACTLFKTETVGNNNQQLLVFAEIQKMFIDDRILKQDSERVIVDPSTCNILARLGLRNYTEIGSIHQAQQT